MVVSEQLRATRGENGLPLPQLGEGLITKRKFERENTKKKLEFVLIDRLPPKAVRLAGSITS